MEIFFLEGYTNSHPYSFGGEQYIKKSFSGIPKKNWIIFYQSLTHTLNSDSIENQNSHQ